MTPPRKQPKRARRMWAVPDDLTAKCMLLYANPRSNGTHKLATIPVCVIPTDAASVEEMVERAAEVLYVEAIGRFNDMNKKALAPYARPPTLYTNQARAVVRDLLGLKGGKK